MCLGGGVWASIGDTSDTPISAHTHHTHTIHTQGFTQAVDKRVAFHTCPGCHWTVARAVEWQHGTSAPTRPHPQTRDRWLRIASPTGRWGRPTDTPRGIPPVPWAHPGHLRAHRRTATQAHRHTGTQSGRHPVRETPSQVGRQGGRQGEGGRQGGRQGGRREGVAQMQELQRLPSTSHKDTQAWWSHYAILANTCAHQPTPTAQQDRKPAQESYAR